MSKRDALRDRLPVQRRGIQRECLHAHEEQQPESYYRTDLIADTYHLYTTETCVLTEISAKASRAQKMMKNANCTDKYSGAARRSSDS